MSYREYCKSFYNRLWRSKAKKKDSSDALASYESPLFYNGPTSETHDHHSSTSYQHDWGSHTSSGDFFGSSSHDWWSHTSSGDSFGSSSHDWGSHTSSGGSFGGSGSGGSL